MQGQDFIINAYILIEIITHSFSWSSINTLGSNEIGCP